MKMREIDYRDLRFFSIDEKAQGGSPAFPDPWLMDRGLLFLLDAMRAFIMRPFMIHSTTGGEHVKGSVHYDGLAVDGHFTDLSAAEQFVICEQFNPSGLGFYPYWNSPGIHLDVRNLRAYEKGARWWRDEAGAYHAVTPDVLRKFLGRP